MAYDYSDLLNDAQDWAKNNQSESRATAAQVAEQHHDPSIQLLGTIGAAVADAAHSGSSIDEAFSGGNVDIPKDPDQYSLWHSTQTSTNISHLKNARIDKLLEDGRTELDQEIRKKIYLDFRN